MRVGLYLLFVLIIFNVSTGHCLKPCVLLRFHWDEKMIEFCHSSQNECCHSPWKKLDPASYLKLHDIIHLHRDKSGSGNLPDVVRGFFCKACMVYHELWCHRRWCMYLHCGNVEINLKFFPFLWWSYNKTQWYVCLYLRHFKKKCMAASLSESNSTRPNAIQTF